MLTTMSAPSQANMTVPSENRQASFDRVIEANQAHSISTAQKIERLSATLLGAPYVDGNLGEGINGKYDKDPLWRFNEFDCTTYVETVLAGAMSQSANDFVPNLLKIRYDHGQVSFVTRNHFPSVDWIPNNHWMLKDITQQIGGTQTALANTIIDKKAWYQRMALNRIQNITATPESKKTLLIALKKEGRSLKPESVSTPYIPLSAIFLQDQVARSSVLQQRLTYSTINQALLNRIPTGSVISMVRPNYNVKRWIGTNMNITHQAIAIRKHGRLYIRNASLIMGKVVDQEFVHYFSRYLEGSSLKGFNVQLPTF
ncbi:N-acetylmuramoyl-L-alanine amidase-like domain-containing protein [Marinomonas flavescens]|uniref:N-acetylmuramoyl-L-alanine amidase-like domain-containing protein n=1 Tax=Marinomonas flavescens TaxID=2529379 RepID=UPI001404F8E6|nr:N-acetylmuramoyl-L-alanine amidase-like domain-containing protein [Marinomonas flavescens]